MSVQFTTIRASVGRLPDANLIAARESRPTGAAGRVLIRKTEQVERAAKRFAPARTGALRMSLHSSYQWTTGTSTVGSPLHYSKWLNDGVRPHIIRAAPGKHLKYFAGGVLHNPIFVLHPGFQGVHYLEKALATVFRA
jgi:hypothetical protein